MIVFSDFAPPVRVNQKEALKISLQNVRAILILDNNSVHLSEEKLVREDGKIRVLYLPPKTTLILQLMDQKVISALKRCYISHHLNEILVVFKEDTDFDVDTWGEKIFANIKNYNIHSAVHNFAAS